MTFHRTTVLPERELANSKRRSMSIESEVLTYFSFTIKSSPWAVWKKLKVQIIHSNTPLNTIRTAITNLTNKGYLIKTTEQVAGDYGKPEHLWLFVASIDDCKEFVNKRRKCRHGGCPNAKCEQIKVKNMD